MHLPRYYTTDAEGLTEFEPGERRLRALLSSLDDPDLDYPDVTLSHASGWSVTAHAGGLVVLENLERPDRSARHRRGLTNPEILAIWNLLAAGDLTALEQLPWSPGER